MIFMADQSTSQAENTLIIAQKTLVTRLITAFNFRRFFLIENLETGLFVRMYSKSEEVADKIRYFQFLLARKDIS